MRSLCGVGLCTNEATRLAHRYTGGYPTPEENGRMVCETEACDEHGAPPFAPLDRAARWPCEHVPLTKEELAAWKAAKASP